MISVLKRKKGFLFLIFIFSLILRLLFLNNFLIKNKVFFVCADSAEYNNVALKIASGEGISNQAGKPTTYRVPGYSMFLAFFYRLFGNQIKIPLYFQIFISSFIPILVFLLSLVFFPGRLLLAKLSSFFMALNLGSILHSGLILSDSVFLFFFIITLILFFYKVDCFYSRTAGNNQLRMYQYFLGGIFLGISSLIRPVGQFLIIIFTIILLFSNYKLKFKFKYILILLLSWFFVTGGWLLRNYQLTDKFIFHSMSGYHFLTYFAAEVNAKNNSISYAESKNKLLLEWQNELEKRDILTEIDQDQMANKIALKYLMQNKVQTLQQAFINIFKTLFSLNSSYLLFAVAKDFPKYGPDTSAFDKIFRFVRPKTDNVFLIFFIYLEMIFLFIILWGFLLNLVICLFDQDLLCSNLKILPIIGLMLVLTLGSGVARLRLPIEPIMIIFSFNFYLNLFRKKFAKN